jgi:hypothetical protein
MRNKSLIFLALIVLGTVGCNKEATNVKEAEKAKEMVAAPAVIEQQNKEAPVAAAPVTGADVTNAATVPATSK